MEQTNYKIRDSALVLSQSRVMSEYGRLSARIESGKVLGRNCDSEQYAMNNLLKTAYFTTFTFPNVIKTEHYTGMVYFQAHMELRGGKQMLGSAVLVISVNPSTLRTHFRARIIALNISPSISVKKSTYRVLGALIIAKNSPIRLYMERAAVGWLPRRKSLL